MLRSLNWSGWIVVPILFSGLAGCATGPAKSYIASSASQYLDQHAVCATMPSALRSRRFGETSFVELNERALLEPFLTANLIALVDKPAALTDSHPRLWFEISDYGSALLTQCPSDSALPESVEWGFKIGTRQVVDVFPAARPTRFRCISTTFAVVTYRLQIDAPWFAFDRFRTNLSETFDPVKNEGRTAVPFTKVGSIWSQRNDVLGAHARFECGYLNRRGKLISYAAFRKAQTFAG
jgi:hypothetical protein